MATFVLVHGSSGGGWIWQKLTPLLCAGGGKVYTPTLTGPSARKFWRYRPKISGLDKETNDSSPLGCL
jgi:hypothetical protein